MPNVREGGECIHSLHSFLFIKTGIQEYLQISYCWRVICKSLTKFGQTKERTVMDTVQHESDCQVMLPLYLV